MELQSEILIEALEAAEPGLRLVRKVSRKRYYSKAVYEHERILVPVPAEERNRVRRWLGRDLHIVVEHLDYGFALLAVAENPYIDGLPATHRFRLLVRALERS